MVLGEPIKFGIPHILNMVWDLGRTSILDERALRLWLELTALLEQFCHFCISYSLTTHVDWVVCKKRVDHVG